MTATTAAAAARPDQMDNAGSAGGIAAKVVHVKRAGQTRDHECHWPGCGRQVPPAMWGCTKHWFALPKPLRDRIWATYRPGQEATMTPSRAYLAAADAVQQWISEHLASQAPAASRQGSLL